jgi:hypothetical protein
MTLKKGTQAGFPVAGVGAGFILLITPRLLGKASRRQSIAPVTARHFFSPAPYGNGRFF